MNNNDVILKIGLILGLFYSPTSFEDLPSMIKILNKKPSTKSIEDNLSTVIQFRLKIYSNIKEMQCNAIIDPGTRRPAS